MCHYRLLHVTYVCMMSGCEKYDRIRGTPSWRGTGGQYDCVVINGKTQMEFVHIHTFLILHSVSNVWHLALVHQYCYMSRHPSSSYIRLKPGRTDFINADSILWMVHILPASTYNDCLTVQDLQPDIHLRLADLHWYTIGDAISTVVLTIILCSCVHLVYLLLYIKFIDRRDVWHNIGPWLVTIGPPEGKRLVIALYCIVFRCNYFQLEWPSWLSRSRRSTITK